LHERVLLCCPFHVGAVDFVSSKLWALQAVVNILNRFLVQITKVVIFVVSLGTLRLQQHRPAMAAANMRQKQNKRAQTRRLRLKITCV
jgi:hypothetical protein